ncbi:HAD family hydrolase [Nocardia sp. NPDC057353]|uniref:HAD family hydrolase n=1 Tax=Nocardia sp. NPDC057353 TaxID=3346104 RepID=UPI00363649CE
MTPTNCRKTREIRAVVFDWRGTLVSELDPKGWVAEALRRAGRSSDRDAVTEVLAAIHTPELKQRLQSPHGNTSTERHRETFYGVFEDANLDSEVADALWDIDSDPSYNHFADDTASTFDALRANDCKIGILSNIHFDIRPLFAEAGLLDRVETFVMSFQCGLQKPDPRIFLRALTDLGTSAEETLMVGDRPSRDGAAVDVGMRTLLVPTLRDPRDCRLDLVTAAVRPVEQPELAGSAAH